MTTEKLAAELRAAIAEDRDEEGFVRIPLELAEALIDLCQPVRIPEQVIPNDGTPWNAV